MLAGYELYTPAAAVHDGLLADREASKDVGHDEGRVDASKLAIPTSWEPARETTCARGAEEPAAGSANQFEHTAGCSNAEATQFADELGFAPPPS